MSLLIGPSIWSSSSSSGGSDPALAARVDVLENKYVRTTRFEIISGTTGTVTLPTNSEVVLDDFGGTVDAVISTASGGKPLYANAVSSGGAIITTSFDSSGNYVLSAAPTAATYCIIYRVRQLLVNFDSTSSNIIGIPTVSSGNGSWGSITGTLSDQTDLQSALDNKVPFTGAQQAKLKLDIKSGIAVCDKGSESLGVKIEKTAIGWEIEATEDSIKMLGDSNLIKEEVVKPEVKAVKKRKKGGKLIFLLFFIIPTAIILIKKLGA